MPRLSRGLVRGEDGVVRCWWPGDDDLYRRYHDREWGFPVTSDTRLFEKLCLEGFQAGLAWITILRKRQAFRSAFHDFDIGAIASFTSRDAETLLRNPGIVRNRAKIESTIQNARRALELRREFGSLSRYLWSWRPQPDERPHRITQALLPGLATSPKALALSQDLKKRGWTFVGPTIVYSFMQAMGLVNDHLEGCTAGRRVAEATAAFKPPTAPPCLHRLVDIRVSRRMDSWPTRNARATSRFSRGPNARPRSRPFTR